MDPENVKEFGWAIEGEERLTEEITTEEAKTRERVAQDPSTFLGHFELSEADRKVLADSRVQARIVETTAEECRRGVGGWVDDDLCFVKPWGFDVSELTVPVEVRYGATDVLVPAGHGDWLAAHVPNAVVVKDPGDGHMSSPEKVVEELVKLARLA
jgi:pimeloyl-ACP methyl ester carboxylesterase